MKHVWRKIQVWGCFATVGIVHIDHIKGIIDQKVYKQILIYHMRPSLVQFGGKDHKIF